MPQWEHFEHVADVGVRGVGATSAEAFEQAALALTAVVTDPTWVAPAAEVSIHCGSRGLGHQIGSEFLKAMALAARKAGVALPDRELAYASIAARRCGRGA